MRKCVIAFDWAIKFWGFLCCRGEYSGACWHLSCCWFFVTFSHALWQAFPIILVKLQVLRARADKWISRNATNVERAVTRIWEIMNSSRWTKCKPLDFGIRLEP